MNLTNENKVQIFKLRKEVQSFSICQLDVGRRFMFLNV